MEDKIKLLDLEVNLYGTKEAAEEAGRLLEADSVHMIYFVNSETFTLMQNDEAYATLVQSADMVLPGDGVVNDGINALLGYNRDPLFLESFFDILFDRAVETGQEIFYLANSEKEQSKVIDGIRKTRPFLSISGTSLEQYEESETFEALINQVNSVAPDVLVIGIEEKKQISLIDDYRNQINTRIILCVGSMFERGIVRIGEIPAFFEKLKLENLYKWLRRGKKIHTISERAATKKRIKKDSIKEDLSNDDSENQT